MTPESADLWGRAIQAFETARSTVTTDPDASASRAYYSAFYGVSSLFALEGKSFSRHSALEIAVHRDLVKAGHWRRELGEDYAFLLRLRTTGDYGGHLHVSHQEAQSAIEAARLILQAIQESKPELSPKFTDY